MEIPLHEMFSLPAVIAGQRVVVTSREIGRNNVIVGTVVRSGSQLHVGDVLLWDDFTGPSRHVRVIASEPSRPTR